MRKPLVSDYEVMAWIDAESAKRTARVKAVLMEEGRPDLVEELEANLRNVANGVSSALSTWAALSAAQRRVLEALEPGRVLIREHGSKSWYDASGAPGAMARVCRLPTARNLIARELLECEGGAFDPERRLSLTERARFVLSQARKEATRTTTPET